MKYLVYYKGEFTEFANWNDCNYFIMDKPNIRYRKITSKKAETEFRKSCEESPEYQQKIYVIIVGDTIQRFDNWQECKKIRDKHPDARYKSFTSEEDAQNFININAHGRISKYMTRCEITEACASKHCEKNDIIFEIYKDNNLIHSEQADALAFTPSNERECEAIIKAIKWAISYNEECIVIEYRNTGSEMWGNGTWKANKDFSKRYQNKIKEFRKDINIEFRKHV